MFGKGKESGGKRPPLLQRLRAKLNRGNSWLTTDVRDLLPGGRISEQTLEELESRLLSADVGVEATEQLLDGLRGRIRRSQLEDLGALEEALRSGLMEILGPCEAPLAVDPDIRPYVVLMIGVNGAGKTTTAGKLAARLVQEGRRVMLAAGDTFRAAAVEQLQVWGERAGAPVIAQGTGADPAAVIYDALEAARARDMDVLIADTAGRLHTQSGLMDELAKVRRVVRRWDPAAPHETLLVLDAGQGQNALAQARRFNDAIGVSGIAINKLDGTAKGGILVAIAGELALPIRFIGIGEGLEDLEVFRARPFTDALLGDVAALTGE